MTTRLCAFVLAFVAFLINAMPQAITPKRLKMLTTDILAQKEPRTDAAGRKCAVIRVAVVGKPNLTFKEAVGNVHYADNEYIVYVQDGTKTLSYTDGSEQSSIALEDYGPEISTGTTYSLILETEQKSRSAIFYIKPITAKLVVGGQRIALDKSGKGVVNLPIGKYAYSITADNYQSEQGTVDLKEDEVFVTKDFELEPLKKHIFIHCPEPTAALFIDGKPRGTIESQQGRLTLPYGKHAIRVTKQGFKDYERNVSIGAKSAGLNLPLKEYKAKYVYHRNERTKSSVSLRNHTDILFGGGAFMDDDFGSYYGRYNVDWHQYLGYVAFKEGLGLGFMHTSIGYLNKFDEYAQYVREDEANRTGFAAEIPLQFGFAVPLSRYNTSHVTFLAGGYGAYYYLGHSSTEMITNESVATDSFDFGLRANVNFYFHKFILSFEGSKSLSKMELGTYIGLSIGVRVYGGGD